MDKGWLETKDICLKCALRTEERKLRFQSLTFALFLPCVLAVYYAAPVKLRKWVLLCANLFFFLWADLLAGIWVALSVCSTWATALLLEPCMQKRQRAGQAEPGKKRSIWPGVLFWGCLALNFGLLAVFRYLPVWEGLMNASLGRGIAVVRLDVAGRMGLVAPLGISFYTLQAGGYLLDVRAGKYPPEKDFVKYAVFVTFFPNILSGPIERGDHFLPQLSWVLQKKRRKLWDYDRFAQGLIFVAWGFFLKMVIADRAAVLVDHLYGMYEFGNSFTMLAAMLFYAVQLYCDFASYSCIAAGVAELMGFSLQRNFRQPYFALGISDFWKRWHISLSSWLRDYVYIPLGGNKKGVLAKYFNLLLVFLVSGLWHGGTPVFLAWGLLHGVLSIAEDLYKRVRKRCLGERKLPLVPVRRLFGRVCTFLTVSILWIFFRSDTLEMAKVCLVNLFTGWQGFYFAREFMFAMGLDQVQMTVALCSMGVLFLFDAISERKKKETAVWIYEAPLALRWGICMALVTAAAVFGMYGPGYDASSFIYIQF